MVPLPPPPKSPHETPSTVQKLRYIPSRYLIPKIKIKTKTVIDPEVEEYGVKGTDILSLFHSLLGCRRGTRTIGRREPTARNLVTRRRGMVLSDTKSHFWASSFSRRDTPSFHLPYYYIRGPPSASTDEWRALNHF